MTGSYEKNLQLLEKQNPLLALKLRLLKPVEGTSQKAMLQPDAKTEILYVYGLGSCYDALKKWLRENPARRLIFIEDEQERFGYFLNQVETERVLLDPQVQLIALIDSDARALEKVIQKYLFRPYECLIMPWKNNQFLTHFSDLHLQCEMMMCWYRDYGVPQMTNVFANLKKEAYLGENFRGEFENTPAIICGAGPSLEKNCDVLKTLGDSALIFAGGTALTLLKKQGVPLHFGASIDPDPPLERYEPTDLPFFYQNQVAQGLLDKVKGPLICLGGSGGFPLEQWLMPNIPPFDAGTHVGTFLAHVATLLGCSPIIFVGMDGCRRGETLYYDGVEEQRRNDPLIVEDRFGEAAQSRRDFILGRRYLEKFATDHPQTLFLNATEGGLSMSGIEDLSLQEVKNLYLTKKVDAKALWQEASKSQTPIAFATHLDQLKKSVEKCSQICNKLLEAIQKNVTGERADYALLDQELSEEVFYELLLLPCWKMWQPFIQNEEVVSQMQAIELEKRLQQTLFYRDLCEQYARIL
ncbi:motility associated factor glycosyltransferase family protein [Simkania sp.]|uniref:motility associated factor glycosyltransferase family protein n=1 Tax=Simkania sp. TaxID=34094 RepID=UPI003B51F8BB